MSGVRRWVPLAIALPSLLILIGLGAWQWQRRTEKTELIARIEARRHAAPLPVEQALANAGGDTAALEYVPVIARGRFDHAREAHVFFSLARPRAGQSGPGYLVVTPFALATGGLILVNRGFTPEHRKDGATRSEGQSEGDVEITGLLRLPERRGPFAGTDDPAKNIFYVRDPTAIARAKAFGPVLPVIIDVHAPTPAGGLPVPAVTQTEIPNNHLNYALTWWSLAAALGVILTLFMRQRTR